MGNLKYQLKRKLESLKKYGRSKHEEKKLLQENAKLSGKKISSIKAEGIFSRNTFKAYMDRGQKFGDWMQINHPDVKHITQIKKCNAEEYLLELKDKGLRAATLQTYTAALAKLLDCNCAELNKNLPTKRSQIPEKGRNSTNNHFSIETHKDLIEFIKNTGLRASEAKKIKPEQIKLDKENNVYLDLKSTKEFRNQTKGGRGRIVTIISENYQKTLLKIKETSTKLNQKTVWEKYGKSSFKNGNLHQYRRMYVQCTYSALCQEIEEKTGFSPDMNYHSRKYNEYYNKEIVEKISEQLGHSRVDTIINNYFR